MQKEFYQDKIRHSKTKLAEHGKAPAGALVTRRLNVAESKARAESITAYPSRSLADSLITQRINRLLGWLAVFFVGAFLVVGNVLTIILFPVAEFMAVRQGIMAFEAHSALATLNAAVVVIGLVSLLFIRNLLRDNLPDNSAVPRVSLRRTWRGLRHFITGNGQEAIKLQSEALYLAAAGSVTLLQVVIVLLGFMGRVRDAMTLSAANGDTYYAFIGNLFLKASPVEFVGYIGTIFLTIALLAVTDLVVVFIYRIFISVAGELRLEADDSGELRNRFFDERKLELQAEALADLLIQVEAKSRTTE